MGGIHHRGEAGDFAFALLGRGTLLVRADTDRFPPGSYRALLSRVDQERAARSLIVEQAAFYLPKLTSFSNPLDIGGAAVSYARRHPELKGVYVVAPQRGLISLVIDMVVRSVPGLDARFLRNPMAALPFLRRREPDLPSAWHELLA
jgi:hypothetical protein